MGRATTHLSYEDVSAFPRGYGDVDMTSFGAERRALKSDIIISLVYHLVLDSLPTCGYSKLIRASGLTPLDISVVLGLWVKEQT